jgi:hypothetical protein
LIGAALPELNLTLAVTSASLHRAGKLRQSFYFESDGGRARNGLLEL